MSTTLASLLVTQSASQIFNTLLAQYQAAGFPVTAWQPGGVERTRLMAIATGLSSLSGTYIPAIAGGSLLDYAPNYPGWTALTAAQIYSLTQNAATFTTGSMMLTNASATSYPYTDRSLKFTFKDSNRSYYVTGSGTVTGSTNTTISVIAEFSGAAYADPSNSAQIVLTTPLAGVTVTNPASTYSSVTHVGSGTGTLTLAGSPVGPHTVTLTVSSTSTGNPVTVSYSLDGAASVSAGSVSSITNLGGTGINVTFVAGTGTSWVANDTYTFSTPGSWITSQGANTETDTALAIRCRGRWSSLSAVPTSSLYQLLAMSTPSVGSQVTGVLIQIDQNVNNKINIIIWGPGGVLPGATVTAVQSYITPRARGCDNPVVQSPTTTAITYAATVTVNASQLLAATSAINTAINNYTANAGVNATLRLSTITELVMQVSGVVDISGVTINGSAANLTLGGSSSFVLPAYPPTINFTYGTV